MRVNWTLRETQTTVACSERNSGNVDEVLVSNTPAFAALEESFKSSAISVRLFQSCQSLERWVNDVTRALR